MTTSPRVAGQQRVDWAAWNSRKGPANDNAHLGVHGRAVMCVVQQILRGSSKWNGRLRSCYTPCSCVVDKKVCGILSSRGGKWQRLRNSGRPLLVGLHCLRAHRDQGTGQAMAGGGQRTMVGRVLEENRKKNDNMQSSVAAAAASKLCLPSENCRVGTKGLRWNGMLSRCGTGRLVVVSGAAKSDKKKCRNVESVL